MVTIMVTGAGAIIGYAAVKLFKQQGFRVVACDIYPDAVGQYWADEFYKVPLTQDVEVYTKKVKEIVSFNKVNFIVPCIEQDVAFYNETRAYWACLGTQLALNRAELIVLCSNKLDFHHAMMAAAPDLAIPSLASADSFDDARIHLGPVMLAKPMVGYARKHHLAIRDHSDFAAAKPLLGKSHFLQELIGRDDMEFTVAIYGDGEGKALCQIQLQRQLSPAGATQSARVVHRSDIDAAVQRLSRIFKPLGPTNLQFRLHNGRPLLLEINPRLSSSLSIRAKFGFDDCSMLAQHLLEGILPSQPLIGSGIAMRYLEDVIVSDRDHF